MTDTLRDALVGAFMSAGDDHAAAGADGDTSAADRYLAIIAPVNEVVALFNSAADDRFKAQTIQALSLVLGLVTTEIERADWPPEAHEAVQELVVATEAASTAADGLVSNLTSKAAAVFADEVLTLTTASSKMREALGLPLQSENR